LHLLSGTAELTETLFHLFEALPDLLLDNLADFFFRIVFLVHAHFGKPSAD
jgi:hypothetical protein